MLRDTCTAPSAPGGQNLLAIGNEEGCQDPLCGRHTYETPGSSSQADHEGKAIRWPVAPIIERGKNERGAVMGRKEH